MLSERLISALNSQMNFELYSSYIYLSMSSYLKGEGLNGFANWMQVQVQEEIAHAMKFYEFLHERGANVVFETIDKPKESWNSPLEAFEDAYKHEQIVTSRINDLMDLALEEKDHATNAHLQWFITEQVEEESSVMEVVQQLKMIKDSPNALFMIDREMGQRVFTPPAP